MPHIDCAAVRRLGADIESDVTPVLEEADRILPNLGGIEQALYTSVHIGLAGTYSTAVSYMRQTIQGAAEAFTTMNTRLDECAAGWDGTEQTLCRTFDQALASGT